MIFLVYSEANERNIAGKLGRSEYSYHFVLQMFRPLLQRLGVVVEITDPLSEVDAIWERARSHGEACTFLCFNPPHKTPIGLRCPTIPVFAWEFGTIPDEVWDDEPRHDWTHVIKALGKVIVHSAATAAAVDHATGHNIQVANIPAPVWDRYAGLRARLENPATRGLQRTIELSSTLVDSATFPLDGFEFNRPESQRFARADALLGSRTVPRIVELDGVVYTSVLNPFDSRKRVWDLMTHFVWALRNRPDATLILKMTHADMLLVMVSVLTDLAKLKPFRCRIIAVHGYLSQSTYDDLIDATTYVLNSSTGEGQCLPLMEFMSCGKPAIAPRNTAMLDYVDGTNSFVVDCSPEPTSWPHDRREMIRTLRARVDFQSLMSALQASFIVARSDPERYRSMSASARETLRCHCSDAVTLERLRDLLGMAEGDIDADESANAVLAGFVNEEQDQTKLPARLADLQYV